MWIKHPRSKEPDTMLTVAIFGFFLVVVVTLSAIAGAWIHREPSYLQYIALIDGAILTSTTAAYTVRKYTDLKSEKLLDLLRPSKPSEK